MGPAIRIAGILVLAGFVWSPVFAQGANAAARRQTPVSVPFVGCASSGQVQRLEAPKGTSRRLTIRSSDAEALAYYRSADGLGLLGPRGWYCLGLSGSSGYVLYLSPQPIHRDMSGTHGLEGPAIEISHTTNEASGRYTIAEIIGRVFPAYWTLEKRALNWTDLPFRLPFPLRPFPNDTLTHRGKTIVEYETPAQTQGLGNFQSWLRKNDLPIRGVVMLVGDPPNVREGPDLVLLSVRLAPSLSRLIPVIVGQVERDMIGAR